VGSLMPLTMRPTGGHSPVYADRQDWTMHVYSRSKSLLLPARLNRRSDTKKIDQCVTHITSLRTASVEGLIRRQPRSGTMSHSNPIELTDSQLDQVYRCAEPLHPHDRTPYLERVAEMLRGREIGDGVVARAVREAQAQFMRAPEKFWG
jgi:hypothetical protein